MIYQNKLTKKAFNEGCSVHVYGRGINKRNAIYYGVMHDADGHFRGYQFMIKAPVYQYKLSQLRHILYLWVTGEANRPYSIATKYACTIEDAFKISLAG